MTWLPQSLIKFLSSMNGPFRFHLNPLIRLITAHSGGRFNDNNNNDGEQVVTVKFLRSLWQKGYNYGAFNE